MSGTDATEVLRQIVSLKAYDANKGRSNAGRRATVNIPIDVWNRARELVSTMTDPNASVPGRVEVARELLRDMT